jgi:hypothetical protein
MTDNETPEFEYQEEQPESQAQVDLKNSEQSLITTEKDVQVAKERVAFEAYVKNNGDKIPENFKDAGAWFDSLKNAQKEYTKSRQELAALKTEYAKQGAVNKDYKETVAAPVVENKPQQPIPEILRIPKNETVAETTTPEAPPVVTESDWKSWTVEFATQGTLSESTQKLIKEKTKLPDYVINEYMLGQKAKIEMAYTKAADIIGGKDHLNKLFTWASKNLSQTEQDNMNASLASPNWEITLLGLNGLYNRKNPNLKQTEPEQTSTNSKPSMANTQVPDMPYRTKREFSNERNNPRFATDAKYRAAVEKRMLQTDFNKLQP